MWMQKSVEGGGAMNVHDRNRFAQGSPYAAGGYSGGGGGAGGLGGGAGDWKSKILESGQWLGGKVIEYGGKIARGASHESVPEHMRGVPHNDGRASWMADIRNSSFTNTDYQGGGFSGGATYQNDFATERPNAYSDYSSGGFKPSGSAASYGARPASLSQERYSDHRSSHDKSGRRAKKKSESGRKSKKKSKKRRDASSDSSDASESESDSDTASVKESLSDASLSSDSEADRRKAKASKKHAKKKDSKKKKKKHSNSFYSDEDEDEDEESDDNQSSSKAKTKAKKDDNYSYSFDPSKLPPPPEQKSKKSSKESRSKKSSKSRGRRQSVESSDSDVQQDNQKAKHSKRSARKGKEKPTVNESVDLLGVDFAPQPASGNANAQAYAQPQAANSNLLTSVFDAQPSADPLQDLAGLSFDAPAQTSQHNSAESPMMFGAQTQQQEQQPESLQQDPAGARFLKNLLPENDIVDLNALASEKKPEKSASAAEKKSLNDLQKSKAGEQPVSVMAVNAHAAQQQQMMYQMGQMQLGHPATMQMQMQQMQMQPMQMTPQQQQMMMMNAQMMQQQQLLMQQQQQQQQMRGAQSQPQNASASPQGGAMFSSFQQ